MSRAWSFGGLVSGIVLAVAVSASPAASAVEPEACVPSLRLVWVDRDRTGTHIIAEAEREAARVWGAARITLEWARFGSGRSIRGDEILVVVRSHRLAAHRGADARSRRRTTLGRLIRTSPERPGRLIELALPDIEASVLPLAMHGGPVRDLPLPFRERAMGRALGRVVAHEIGHWLFGRDHTPTGLMRASIRRPDLIAEDPPPLPATWPSAALAQLRTHRPCPAPRAFHQPVTE